MAQHLSEPGKRESSLPNGDVLASLRLTTEELQALPRQAVVAVQRRNRRGCYSALPWR